LFNSLSSSAKQKLEERVLQNCAVEVNQNLDISAIFPQLMSQELLTKEDYETLLNPSSTNVYKVHYLLAILPRKGEGFLRKFIYCLDKTKPRTGHGDIVKVLKETYHKELYNIM